MGKATGAFMQQLEETANWIIANNPGKVWRALKFWDNEVPCLVYKKDNFTVPNGWSIKGNKVVQNGNSQNYIKLSKATNVYRV